MSTVGRTSTKIKPVSLAGLESLYSFKVPKKAVNESVLESVALDSADYADEILPEITQSFRFPQLRDFLRVDEAWLVHNKSLEQSFAAARKRFQKSTSATSTESNYCTGFVVATSWEKVETIANEGLYPGNSPDTWLGQPDLGVTLNQCADLAVARSQKRYSRRSTYGPPTLYLIAVRWVKSRAYLVPPEAELSEDRLEPQPGYACHASTWSRIDPLDPAKLSLERAFQMSQVYLYEFDEDLELCRKPGHVLPVAVVKCVWELNTLTAAALESIGAANGAILILSPKPVRYQSSTVQASPRCALLPTPSSSSLVAYSPRPSVGSDDPLSLTNILGLGFERSSGSLSSTTDKPRRSKPSRNSSRNLITVRSTSPSSTDKSSAEDKPSTYLISPSVTAARKIQTAPDILSRLGEFPQHVPANPAGSATAVVPPVRPTDGTWTSSGSLIGTTMLSWGYPKPEHSLPVEFYTYRRNKFQLFDGLLHPRLRISRLVSHTSLHYELAGLTPRDPKSLKQNGPPALVSVPRDQEWCLPRLSKSTASSLHCNVSSFAGYRGNYFRLTLYDTGEGRTKMSQLCQALCDNALAGVVHIECDESSILFVFSDSQFARSISFPPADRLESNYLHAILLTPHSLDRYPYAQVNCSLIKPSGSDPPQPPTFIAPTSVTVPTDSFYGQRKNVPIPIGDIKLKIPLDALLSSLPDGGKDLLGTALITLLASRRSSDETESSTFSSSDNRKRSLLSGPRLDPRLSRQREMDTHSLASALLSTVAKHPDIFKRSASVSESTPTDEASATDGQCTSTTNDPQASRSPPSQLAPDVSIPHRVSPPAPTSPVMESSSQLVNDEPKEIPLSSSSPSKLAVDRPIGSAGDPVDMEVELDDRCKPKSLQNSDMEVSSSSDYYDSPLKYRIQTSSFRTPSTSKMREPRSNFSFPTEVASLISDCRRASTCSDKNDRNSSELGVTLSVPPDSELGFPRRPYSPSRSHNPANEVTSTSDRQSDVCFKSPITDVRGDTQSVPDVVGHSRGRSDSRKYSGERRNRSPYPSSILSKTTSVYEDGSNALRYRGRRLKDSHSNKPFSVADEDNVRVPKFSRPTCKTEFPSPDFTLDKLQCGLLPSPVLVLEDISKTHPYFKSSKVSQDEGEEGEIVDDDAEEVDDHSENGRNDSISTRSAIGGSFSCVSSDPSSAGLYVVDEKRSSTESSFSTDMSNSSRISPYRRTSRTSQYSPSRARHYDNYKKRSYHDQKSDASLSPYRPKRTSYDPSRVPRRERRVSGPFNLGDEYKLVDQVCDSDDASSNVREITVMPQDEDMRVPLSNSSSTSRIRRSLLPRPADSRGSTHHTTVANNSLADKRSPDRISSSDNSSRSQYFGDHDVDYRRLSSDGYGSTSRRSSDSNVAARHGISSSRHASPGSSGSDYLPKYSVYHPKPEVHERSRSTRDSRPTSVEKYDSYSPDSQSTRKANTGSSRSRSSPFRTSSDWTSKRHYFSRDPPPIPSLPTNPLGLLGSVETPSFPLPVQPTYLSTLPMPPANPVHIWSMAQMLTHAAQMFPSPWKQ